MNPVLAIGLAITLFGIFAEAARSTQRQTPTKRVAAKPVVREVKNEPPAKPKPKAKEDDNEGATE